MNKNRVSALEPQKGVLKLQEILLAFEPLALAQGFKIAGELVQRALHLIHALCIYVKSFRNSATSCASNSVPRKAQRVASTRRNVSQVSFMIRSDEARSRAV